MGEIDSYLDVTRIVMRIDSRQSWGPANGVTKKFGPFQIEGFHVTSYQANLASHTSRPPCWFPLRRAPYWKTQQDVPILFI